MAIGLAPIRCANWDKLVTARKHYPVQKYRLPTTQRRQSGCAASRHSDKSRKARVGRYGRLGWHCTRAVAHVVIKNLISFACEPRFELLMVGV